MELITNILVVLSLPLVLLIYLALFTVFTRAFKRARRAMKEKNSINLENITKN